MNAITLLPADWAARISAAWQSSVRGILETGRLIAEAKIALPHGEFAAMIESALPFGSRTAQRLMAIAADERLANPTHVSHLPASWGTLYELTKLSDDQFEVGIKTGAISPDTERREVVNGARTVMASRQEPDDSLDYFPTPPYATRALVERVLPQLGIRLGQVGSVWEPACGEGHIAEVLREYCPLVIASDIFDYGHGELRDFLAADDNSGADWIITNPPFGDAAIGFVEHALRLSRIGVAMFFRSQWAVEGVERYERIFGRRPPTLCAFFVERVALCKGRFDPDGSTATAYCWLVWHHGALPRPTFWIPPGCREALTRPDDRERFTAHPVMARKPAAPLVPKPAPSVDIPALTAALAGLKLSLNERLHVRAMANRATDGVAIAARDERYLFDIARKYGVEVSPPSGLLAPEQRAALASAFSTNDEVKPCP